MAFLLVLCLSAGGCPALNTLDALAPVTDTNPGDSPAITPTPQTPTASPPAPSPASAPANPAVPEGRVYYVDGANPAARDNNPGTEARPWQTLQRAVDAVRPGDTVLVKAGVYREMLHLTCNGTREQPITFRSFNDDRPIIDGENQRAWCVVIGRNSPAHDAGQFVTLDGFICKNPAGPGFPGGDGGAACILILGTDGVIVRNCEAYRDDFPGYPTRFLTPEYAAAGIVVRGHNVDTLVEYCYVHHLSSGLGSRLSEGDVGGHPIRPRFRWNHIAWNNVDDDRLQNNAAGMGFWNGTVGGVAEFNVTHHNGDQGLGSDDCNGVTFRYNISYLNNHTRRTGGGGDGIKTKPDPGATRGDVVHHNFSFLNTFAGYNINIRNHGARVYNNLAYANEQKGLAISSYPTGPQVSTVKNNVSCFSTNRDIGHDAPPTGVYDFNFVRDGRFKPEASPHMLSGDPGFSNVALLTVDANADGTPDVFDPLNDRAAFPNTKAAVEYAHEQVRLIFSPRPGSPLIDAGVITDLDEAGAKDLFRKAPLDDPRKSNPWGNTPNTGTVDIGPIEFQPT